MNRRVRIRWFSTALVAAVFGYGAVIATGEDFTALVKRLQQEKPEFAKRHQATARGALRSCRPPGPGRHHVARQAGAGRRARAAAQGHDVGETRRHVAGRDQEQEPLAGGLFPLAASPSRGRRHGVPEAAHRRNQEARPVAT